MTNNEIMKCLMNNLLSSIKFLLEAVQSTILAVLQYNMVVTLN